MKKIIGISFLFTILTINLKAQSYEINYPKSFGLYFGYQGLNSSIFEIGLARGFEGETLISSGSRKRSKKVGELIKKPYMNVYGSYHFDPYEKISGCVIGSSLSSIVVYGLDLNYFFMDDYFLGIRPSIGFAICGFELIYRYNFKIIGEKNTKYSGHEFALRYYLPVFVDTEEGYKFGKKYKLN